MLHKPVMLEEVLHYFKLRDGLTVVDGTIGTAGHAVEIVRRISPGGKLIGIDCDQDSLEIAKDRLKESNCKCYFVRDNFSNIDTILNSQGVKSIDRVILDLGISSYQLDNSERGFSFVNEGPLDMRMDKNSSVSAFDLVNNLNQQEISSILWRFGQERFSNRIAKLVVNQRNNSPINTTCELANLVLKAVPYSMRFRRTHPATRTFQALRIAVNHELEFLEIFLNKIERFLNKGAIICIISFHSLEDRIVKLDFKHLSKTKQFKLVVEKPIIPKQLEINDNPRSRSAKLRVLERE